jgi:DNA-binding transcriptional MerR regulator
VTEFQLPDKLFFKIGDVATIVGVKPHVLRYWETEFPALRPMKTRGAHRVYRRKDVELAMLVKQMLQDEGLTIVGAKRRLREMRRDGAPAEVEPQAEPSARAHAHEQVNLRADLLAIRRDLEGLLKSLDAVIRPGAGRDADVSATITAAAPSSIPLRPR